LTRLIKMEPILPHDHEIVFPGAAQEEIHRDTIDGHHDTNQTLESRQRHKVSSEPHLSQSPLPPRPTGSIQDSDDTSDERREFEDKKDDGGCLDSYRLTQFDAQDDDNDHSDPGYEVERPSKIPRFRMRPPDDDEPEDWWFASTAIPLMAATIGPMANVTSIAALVSTWRQTYDPAIPGIQDSALAFADPQWEVPINAVSLVCGFVGNIFLLLNFTRVCRYIIALPVTIFMWILSFGILVGLIITMKEYAPPPQPDGLWSQAFWHAVIAAVLYGMAVLMLMGNMLGYFLGHYTQHFELTDDQRNLILQTMMFFIWLAGGAGVFMRVTGWEYSDALYFCDVTILTVGFGDFAPPNDIARGLVFVYSVGGIITLGLMIGSIAKFARQIGHSNIVRKRIDRKRVHTVSRAVSNSFEASQRQQLARLTKRGTRPEISAPFDPQRRTTISFDQDPEKGDLERENEQPTSRTGQGKAATGLRRGMTWMSTINEDPNSSGNSMETIRRVTSRKPKILILREERDRFLAMRSIQNGTKVFKRWFALAMSVLAFGVLWLIGAMVFFYAEAESQGLSYFEALYFCYVSLTTIGYGDLSPKSNAGKPFFIVWSLFAIPTMTILIRDMSDTIVEAYKQGTFRLADWTIMPKKGFLARFLVEHRRIQDFIRRYQMKKRVERGFKTGPDPNETARMATSGTGDTTAVVPGVETLEELAAEPERVDEHDLATRLAHAIRRVADDLKAHSTRRYTFEEWIEFTRLIKFSEYTDAEKTRWLFNGDKYSGDDNTGGLVDWDWIGETSPMMSDHSECEWVLDRLCESLDRYMHRVVPEEVKERRRTRVESRRKASVVAQSLRRGSRLSERSGSVTESEYDDADGGLRLPPPLRPIPSSPRLSKVASVSPRLQPMDAGKKTA